MSASDPIIERAERVVRAWANEEKKPDAVVWAMWLLAAHAENERLADQLRSARDVLLLFISDVHRRHERAARCDGCGQPWPCDGDEARVECEAIFAALGEVE